MAIWVARVILTFPADGNPHKIPRMGILSGIGHPLFFCPAFRDGNLIGHASTGAEPAGLPGCYGAVDRSIDFGVPFWEG